jgi:Flp pilus assembly protein TadD
VLAALRDSGHSADTLVIVAGDHGEALGEHGERTHGMLLFDATLRVPLVFAGPAVPHAIRDGAVSLVHVAASALRLLGKQVPAGMTDADLAPVASRHGDVYTETLYPRAAGWSPIYGLVEDRWKLLQSSAAKLFDLRADPAEEHDVSSAHESLVRTMSIRLAAIRDSATGPDRRERPTAEIVERLRALGYVTGPETAAAGKAEALPDGSDARPDPATVIQGWTAFEDAENAVTARDYDRALPALKRLVQDHPGSAVFESGYATAIAKSGNLAAALVAARRAAARHPRDPGSYHALAITARDARSLDEALRAEQAAAALDPADPAIQNGLGLLAVDRGRADEAVRAFARAVDLDPTNAQYWTNLGNARRADSDGAGADQAYRRALQLDGHAADAANGLGVLLVQGGRPHEAIPWFERAMAGDSDFYETRLNLGIACQQAGDVARAVRTYREVLQAPARFSRERDAARKLLAALKQ